MCTNIQEWSTFVAKGVMASDEIPLEMLGEFGLATCKVIRLPANYVQ